VEVNLQHVYAAVIKQAIRVWSYSLSKAIKLYISYQLNAQVSLSIQCYSPLHVSSRIMLILRRSNCVYTII